MSLKSLTDRIAKLSKREKAAGVLTVLVLTVAAPYMFFYSPSKKEYTLKKASLEAMTKETAILETALAERLKAVPQPAPALEPVVLPKADDLHGIFLSISTKASELGVDFVSIAPESVSQKDGLMEMKLKLELRLKYRQLFDFIRYVEDKHRMFLVESVKYETNDAMYPSGVALIRAVTYLRKT